ncbi:MAG: gliding motility-associated ABC transporter substrate-binding protein GldG [Bacteroidetes bacterium]|nr:gliding motility-associated ABC transporter substrate-binding protein GldG [Bacteroidota bacterium]
MKRLGSHRLFPLAALIFGVLVLVGFAQTIRFRIDLTEEKRYSLHPSTLKLLENIDRPLHVDILLTGEQLPGGMRRLQKSIEETVRTFNAYSSENITVSYFDPLEVTDSLKEEFIYTLADYGIRPTNLFVNQATGQQEQLIFPGVLVSDDTYETGALVLKGERGMSAEQTLNASIENLEFELAQAIQKLLYPQKSALALIIGHGELAEDDGFGMVEALNGRYELFKVPMEQAQKVEDLSSFEVIFILGPSSPYTERELFLLDQYVMGGGNLVIGVEGVSLDQSQLAGEGSLALPLENSLDRLLYRYGIRVNKDLIQDLIFGVIPVTGGNFGNQEQLVPLPWPYHFQAGRMYPHPITKGLDQVNFRYASSIDTVKADGVIKTPLLFSSERSRIMPLPHLLSLTAFQEPPLESEFGLQNLPLAYLLEGEFTSLFKNRFVPEEFAGSSINTNGNGKVIALGDASLFQSQLNLADREPLPLGEDPLAQTTFANKQFLENLVQYLSDPEGIIATRTKVLQIRPLDKVKVAEEKLKWQLINLGIPVILLGILGGLIGLLRVKRFSQRR